MKFENTEVWGFEHALRGCRNPMASWDKGDSGYIDRRFNDQFHIGKNDLDLAQRLIKAGSEYRKFLRQIFVSVDVTAPSYFMAELDTYKIGVTRNSTSIQHKGISHRYTIDDFEVDDDIKEVLRIKEKEVLPLIYPYETTEYKIYACENGRQYKVFKNGRVFSCSYDLTDALPRTRHFEERELVPSATRSGYYELNIGGRNGERWLLHRLVATVWIDNPNCFETVDHLNNKKGDNSVENLEWVSREENTRREWKNFNGFDLQKNYKNWKISSKVNPAERLKIRELYKTGITQKEITKLFELKQAQISVICRDEKSTSENKELFEHCWYWEQIIDTLNILRDKYLDTKDYKYFRLIRQLMPMGYLYKSTVTMNYENILNMYMQRKNHKLNEWSGKDDSSKPTFCSWVLSLPYAKEFFIEPFEADFKVVKAESRSRTEQERQEFVRGELC